LRDSLHDDENDGRHISALSRRPRDHNGPWIRRVVRDVWRMEARVAPAALSCSRNGYAPEPQWHRLLRLRATGHLIFRVLRFPGRSPHGHVCGSGDVECPALHVARRRARVALAESSTQRVAGYASGGFLLTAATLALMSSRE